MNRLITKHKAQNTKHKAFTLVELIVFMGLFAVLLVVLTNIFVSTLNVQLESQAVSSVQQDGRFILARLAYDINSATNITKPEILGISEVWPGTLELKFGVAKTYTYTIINDQLTLQVDSGQAISLNSFGSKISDLTFERIGKSSGSLGNKDSILITFTLTSTTSSLGKGPERKTFTSTVGMRGN